MEYQTEEGGGVMSGYPAPSGEWMETLPTDTRTENTRKGCEGCEHWQQQFAAAIENYKALQDTMIDDIQTLCEQQGKMIAAFNVIGNQQQQMWDGIGNLMKFLNGIGADLSAMSMMDKVKLARQLMGDKD